MHDRSLVTLVPRLCLYILFSPAITVIAYLISGVAAASAVTTFQPSGIPFKAPVTLAPGLTAHVVFSNLTAPRGIAFDSFQNLLVVERGFGVTAFSPVGSVDSGQGWQRQVVIENSEFTHGIQVDGTELYVSTAGQVLGYSYDPETASVSGAPRVIVDGLPADGELTTHTLQLVKDSASSGSSLFVASGPLTNIDATARDPSSGRSQIRRFSLNPTPTSATPTWLSGDLIAYGIRNPAGFALYPTPSIITLLTSSQPVRQLYVVENGASIDNVTGLTAAFVNDNPADELDLVTLSADGEGGFYGFPDCTTLWTPDADPVGDPQYTSLTRGSQISLDLLPERGDAWCRDVANNVPPALSFQAHSVPLDIKFFTNPGGPIIVNSTALPSTYYGSAFVSFHGSFDRAPPTGYGVVSVPFTSPTTTNQNYEFVIQAADLLSCPGNCIRPVGLEISGGKLYVSSDSSGELFVIEKAL